MKRPPNVVHMDEIQWSEKQSRGIAVPFRRKQLGAAAGGREIGCSLYEIPPKARFWPYHYHLGQEEAVFVLGGRGAVVVPSGEVPIQEGDYIAFPRGPEGGHTFRNDSPEPLQVLVFSTMNEPDIIVHPNKKGGMLGLFAGAAPGGPLEKMSMRKFIRADAEVDFWWGSDEPE